MRRIRRKDGREENEKQLGLSIVQEMSLHGPVQVRGSRPLRRAMAMFVSHSHMGGPVSAKEI